MTYLHLRTARLRLDAVTHDDLDQVHELHADPEVWRHLPSGRHRNREHTAEYITDISRDWATGQLGYWAIRTGGHLDDGPPAGTLIGVGGCALRLQAAWNLYYRLTPAEQGHGFAAEMVTAACAVPALVRERNRTSLAARRAGGPRLGHRLPLPPAK
jgi:RimJ/RimL family protein N-acetyltransferase